MKFCIEIEIALQCYQVYQTDREIRPQLNLSVTISCLKLQLMFC